MLAIWHFGGGVCSCYPHDQLETKLSTLYGSIRHLVSYTREVAVGYAISLKERTVGENFMREMVNYWMRGTFL